MNNKKIHLSVSEETRNKLNKLAKEKQIATTTLIRIILSEYLIKNKL